MKHTSFKVMMYLTKTTEPDYSRDTLISLRNKIYQHFNSHTCLFVVWDKFNADYCLQISSATKCQVTHFLVSTNLDDYQCRLESVEYIEIL